MNSTIKRLAIPAGMAAALGTAGFAFMASNTAPVTSAGEGANGVSGYTVSNVSYQTQQGWGHALPSFSVGSVKFVLTSNATDAPANAKPANVNAALLGTSASKSECTISSWTIVGSGHGTGPVTCSYGTSDNQSSAPALEQDVTGLDVTANQ